MVKKSGERPNRAVVNMYIHMYIYIHILVHLRINVYMYMYIFIFWYLFFHFSILLIHTHSLVLMTASKEPYQSRYGLLLHWPQYPEIENGAQKRQHVIAVIP